MSKARQLKEQRKLKRLSDIQDSPYVCEHCKIYTSMVGVAPENVKYMVRVDINPILHGTGYYRCSHVVSERDIKD